MPNQDSVAVHNELHARPFPSIEFDAHLLQVLVKASATSIPEVWGWLSTEISGLPESPFAWQASMATLARCATD